MRKIFAALITGGLAFCIMATPVWAGHDPMGDITSLVPNRGHQGGAAEITMKVKNRPLGPWDYIQFLFPGTTTVDTKIAAAETKTPDSTTFVAKIIIAADATIGERDVRLNSA
jgi:hypothetical protein